MVGLLGQRKMDLNLESEIEQIVDRQLQELGFIDLCTRIAHKVVEKVQKIDEEHGIVKTELNNIEQRLNLFFTDKKPVESKRTRDVIVIEEDEEKPLVESLHAITKSPSNISLSFDMKEDFESPLKQVNNGERYNKLTRPQRSDSNIDKITTKIIDTKRRTTEISNPQQNVSIGMKRSLDGVIVHRKGLQVSNVSEIEKEISEICDPANLEKPSKESLTSKATAKSSETENHLMAKKDVLNDRPSSDKQPVSVATKNAGACETAKASKPVVKPASVSLCSPTNIQTSLQSSSNDRKAVRKPTAIVSEPSDNSNVNTAVRNSSRPVITTGSPKISLQIPDINTDISDNNNASELGTQEAIGNPEDTQVEKEEAACQGSAESLAPINAVPHEFKEGDRVLGKPDKSEIWYEGTIAKVIVSKYGQQKFQIKFDHGQKVHGTIPINNLALIVNPEPSALNVGSRIVGARPKDTVDARIAKKYISLSTLSKSKDDILFGGIVVERACEENKHRFLVFFDDGFAQYLTVKKMHHVIRAAEKVWEDVSINCREFIKEYLEEYPDRPMVKLKAALSVQTEWNGRWLQARVISVDGSLVKMLFDIDRRTEWIYRGSTRLEPLYSELERRDVEALKAKSKKSAKKKKSTSQAKKVEPYVDDAITKPCYGVSKFSLTDPQGILQKKFWQPLTEEADSSILEKCSISSVESADTDKDLTSGPLKIAFDFEKKQKTPTAVTSVTASASTSALTSTTTPTSATTSTIATASKPFLKRKLDDDLSSQDSDSSIDFVGLENSKKRGTSDIEKEDISKDDSRLSTNQRGSLQRQSSHSSIDSHFSDSQSKHSSSRLNLLERQSSSQSINSNQSNRSESKSRRPSTSSNRSNSDSQSQTICDVNGANSSMVSNQAAVPSQGTPSLVVKRRASSRDRFLDSQMNRGSSNTSPISVASKNSPLKQIDDKKPNQIVELAEVPRFHPKTRGPHDCSTSCVPDVFIPGYERKRHNPLSVPLLLGWTRETAKRRPGYHRDIYYRSPCNKRMRNMSEVTKYLVQNDVINVTIDQFSFDSSISCRDQLPILETPRVKFDDISHGKETVPIPCVNERNDEQPPLVEYISARTVSDRIELNVDPGFLACCDCKDMCQDKSNCSCARLTIDSSDAIDGTKDENCGYQYRRLKECVTTGIYECSQNCSCNSSCYNRVVQNGIGLRLQIFMTNHKGWGVRCLDDIPRGAFICTYTGQILNEEMADKEGTDFGDEYLAELDHIEVVEQAKEGYESDVPELRNEKKSFGSRSTDNSYKESDSDESDFAYSTSSESSDNVINSISIKEESTNLAPSSALKQEWAARSSAVKPRGSFGDVIDLTLDSDNEDETEASAMNRESLSTEISPESRDSSNSTTPSSLQMMIHKLKTGIRDDKITPSKNTNITPRSHRQQGEISYPRADIQQALEFESSNNMIKGNNDSSRTNSSQPEMINFDKDAADKKVKKENPKGLPNFKGLSETNPISNPTAGSEGAAELGVKMDHDKEIKKAAAEVIPHLRKAVARKSSMSILQMLVSRKAKCDMEKNDKTPKGMASASDLERVFNADLNQGIAACSKTFTSPRSSTGGHFARKLTSSRLQITPPTQTTLEKTEIDENGTRRLFGEDHCYVIDAKSYGNVGRYLNHSCVPNLFVQNVFVDTHDLRFPMVAFFAQQNIPALTELTWDYSYDVGSVPGKVLLCCCGALECRGRLL